MTRFLDLETKFFGDERALDEQEIAVAGTMGTAETFRFFLQFQADELVSVLDEADRIVGHNVLAFDYRVIRAATGEDVRLRWEPKTVDTLASIEERHGRRVGLGELADATLARQKETGEAGVPQLWREGKTVQVLDRLRSDVRLVRDLYEHGRDFGWVAARGEESRKLVQLEVDWT